MLFILQDFGRKLKLISGRLGGAGRDVVMLHPAGTGERPKHGLFIYEVGAVSSTSPDGLWTDTFKALSINFWLNHITSW